MPGATLETHASDHHANSSALGCPKYNQLVTHEIVNITDDMKHDAHIVKTLTERSINVLKQNNVNIHKIVRSNLPIHHLDTPFIIRQLYIGHAY